MGVGVLSVESRLDAPVTTGVEAAGGGVLQLLVNANA